MAEKPCADTQVPAQLVGWQLHGSGGGNLVDVGLAVAPQMSSARALPAPGKGLAEGNHLALLLFMPLSWHCFGRPVALISCLCLA